MSGADKSDCASWCGLAADHPGPCVPLDSTQAGRAELMARRLDEVAAELRTNTFPRAVATFTVVLELDEKADEDGNDATFVLRGCGLSDAEARHICRSLARIADEQDGPMFNETRPGRH